MLVQNKQYLAAYLLYLKLVKQNQSNWSCFKQTLERSSCKPSASFTIDWCENVHDTDSDGGEEARSNKQNTQQCSYTSMLGLRSQVVSSKLRLTQLFFFRISESTTGYTFTSCVGYFTSPGIDTS